MSTTAEIPKVDTKPPVSKKSDTERSVSYRPAGASQEMTLTIAYVKNFLTTATKKGFAPSEADLIKFMMLCKASHLNPWQGDAYLVGYDTDDGPVFNLITAVQALLKRAELSPEFDGIEHGVIVLRNTENTDPVERRGTIVLPGELLLVVGQLAAARTVRSLSIRPCSLSNYREFSEGTTAQTPPWESTQDLSSARVSVQRSRPRVTALPFAVTKQVASRVLRPLRVVRTSRCR